MTQFRDPCASRRRSIGACSVSQLRLRIAAATILGALACVAAIDCAAQTASCPARGVQDADCGQHNMMLVGDQAIFASHLPMFESPHRFQLILRVDLAKGPDALDVKYTEDRKANPAVTMYTLAPRDRFVLARLFSEGDATRMRSFAGTVFRGHLERGGVPLQQLTAIDVEVKQVVYAAEIGRPNGPDRSSDLQYIVFGRGAETFLAHRITQPPDFDQLLKVKIANRGFTDEELDRGVLLTVSDRPNSAKRRLRQGETAAVKAHVTGAHVISDADVTVVAEAYFEEGELAETFETAPTALEIEAGFGDAR